MKSDMENKDWLNDYMSLKQVSTENPFTVPAGYFDDLGDRIVSARNLDELKNNNPLDGFAVPENYFQELAGNIQSRLAIEEALDKEHNDFTVPEGYFDNLAQQIHSRILVEEALGEPAEQFTVPAGYFDSLAQQIQSRILVEEALGEPAEQFTVPEGYFEELNSNILAKTVEAGNTNRKGIVRRMFASTAFKYATAACFTVALGGGILLTEIANNPVNQHNNSFLHKQLSNVPVDEIKSYLQLNVDAGDTQQTVASEGTTVNDADLKNALQNYVDSVQ
jgi:hypothetical protein